MSMKMFRFLSWVAGFVYIAEGIARLVSFGFWLPAWSTVYGTWMFDLDS